MMETRVNFFSVFLKLVVVGKLIDSSCLRHGSSV